MGDVVHLDREKTIRARAEFLMQCADRATGGATEKLRSEEGEEAREEQQHRYRALALYYFALSDGYKKQQLIDGHRTQRSKIAAITSIACASAGIIDIRQLRNVSGADMDDLDDPRINARLGVIAARQIIGCQDILLELKSEPVAVQQPGVNIDNLRSEALFDPTFMRIMEHLMRLGSCDPLTTDDKQFLRKNYDEHEVIRRMMVARGALNPFARAWRDAFNRYAAPIELTPEQIAYMQWMISIWQALELAHRVIDARSVHETRKSSGTLLFNE